MYNNLRVENITNAYNKKVIINNISFNISRGESVALLGPNGAGKSTCFKIIIGLIIPKYGNLYLDSLNITHMPIHKRGMLGISYLPQESSIFKGLTVYQNIMAVLEIINYPINLRKNSVDQLLEEFFLTQFSTTKASLLSGGIRRKLEIARTLAVNPNFILLDEPLAGIDPIAIEEIRKIILKLQKRNIGILITDHNVREALSMVDRAYILYNGNILFNGSVNDIIKNKKVQEIYLGNNFN